LGRCGDGNCDAKEKANPRLCPEDCDKVRGGETSTESDSESPEISAIMPPTGSIQSRAIYSEVSPFGVHPGSINNYDYFYDLGLTWNREGLYLIWEWIDVNRNGEFRFKKATIPSHPGRSGRDSSNNYDAEINNILQDVYFMKNVCPFKTGGGQFNNEKEKEIYSAIIKAMVERYVGDYDLGCTQNFPDCYVQGDNEYPSQELREKLKKIRLNIGGYATSYMISRKEVPATMPKNMPKS
jgi:hypothetical protein